jgi:hypothetical protein
MAWLSPVTWAKERTHRRNRQDRSPNQVYAMHALFLTFGNMPNKKSPFLLRCNNVRNCGSSHRTQIIFGRTAVKADEKYITLHPKEA